MNNLIYGIREKPKKWYEWIIYPIQMLLAVFVATVLIATICGVPIAIGLIGGCIGTIVYQLVTRFKSPMYISNSGATVSAVLGALILGSTFTIPVTPELIEKLNALNINTAGLVVGGLYTIPTPQIAAALNVPLNYFAVLIGGFIIFIVYAIFALLIKLKGISILNKIFPPMIVGSVTIVIGMNLAGFIPGYVGLDTASTMTGVLIALFTMVVVALSSHFFKGFAKTIPFLFGLIAGSIVAVICYFIGQAIGSETFIAMNVFDTNAINGLQNWLSNPSVFALPDFGFFHWQNATTMEWNDYISIIILFVPVSICALLEHYSDHKVLSNILGTDLTVEPGLHRTLLGDGLASAVGCAVCGLPNTSYGESIATIGFSRVASVWVTLIAALLMGLLGFIAPVQILLQLIPSAVFGGCAMILYGYIAASGLKTIINNKVDLEDNKNLVIVSVILTIGVSGIWLFTQSFAGTSLAMVVGVVLNLLLFRKKLPETKK